MKKISVCVPSFNRPDTLRQLINSFLLQDYPNKELIISDDTPTDIIKKLTSNYNETSIKYFQNTPRLGFYKNLFKSMERATGDYILILGDDDILFSPQALSEYVSAFMKDSSIGFVYSNIVQFSNKNEVEFIARFVLKNKVFKKGENSIKNVWIRTMFIGGMGIKNDINILNCYPKKPCFYPQVEFVGHIINKYNSIILANENIGFRSSNEHFIFKDLKKDNKIGRHITVEFLNAFNKLSAKYKFDYNSDFLTTQLINFQSRMMFKERLISGVKQMEKDYTTFCDISVTARRSVKLKIRFLLAKYLPPLIIVYSMRWLKSLQRYINKSEVSEYEVMLFNMIGNSLRE